MIASLSWAPLVLAGLATSAAAQAQTAPTAGEVRTPPAPHCLDARGVRQVEQATPGSIAVRGANGQAYRVDFSADCPGINEAAEVRLDAPAGWACGRPSEQVTVDGRRCAISAVSVIGNRDFAEAARESSRQFATTLPTVTVTGTSDRRSSPRRGFHGTPEFCFATRHVRSWNEDPQGVVVETNPRRNGGHRYYRVELGSSCSILAGATEIDFQSGFQNGLICGNPGDRIVMTPSGIQGDLLGTQGDLRFSTPRFTRPGCSILAVYPKDQAARGPATAPVVAVCGCVRHCHHTGCALNPSTPVDAAWTHIHLGLSSTGRDSGHVPQTGIDHEDELPRVVPGQSARCVGSCRRTDLWAEGRGAPLQ